MEILKEPSSLLRQKSQPVTNLTEAKEIADKLLATIRIKAHFWNRWLGLAANQIGYPKRAIVIRSGKDRYELMINPQIVEKRIRFPQIERCFSLRGAYLTKRYLRAKIKYQDLDGKWHHKSINGPSVIYQELDHLDGILVSDIGLRIL